MRALVLAAAGTIRVDEVADPVVEHPTDAIVEVELAGLCGSDLHPYLGREPARFGVVQGHEAIGVVSEVGPGVDRFRPGDSVVVPFTVSCGRCDACGRGLSSRCASSRLFGWGDPDPDGPVLAGCQAEQLRVPMADTTLVGWPTGLPADRAILLTDNYPTAWHAVQRAAWHQGTLAVIGLGAVGLCAVAAASAVREGPVLAIDPVEARRAAADRVWEHVSTAEPDAAEEVAASLPPVTAVVEAAGPIAAQELATRLAGSGATISIIAVQTGARFGIDPVTAYDKNLSVVTGRAPVRSVLDRILDGLGTGRLHLPEVVTHGDRPLEDGPDLYSAFARREDAIVKATFRP